eukprot:GHVT01047529.1.p1 GENE.GHVT01047529.1~~GHVT01047529.1.p1  ORF type:complete len:285 (-),score=55.01 GHVT01047529.1:868-1722(-)
MSILETDKKNLCRSISRLKERLAAITAEANSHKQQAAQEQQERSTAQSNNLELRKALESAGDLRRSLVAELEKEKAGRRQLKANVQAKLKKVEEEQRGWAEVIRDHNNIVDRWKKAAEEYREQARAASSQAQEKSAETDRVEAARIIEEAAKKSLSKRLEAQMVETANLNAALVASKDRVESLESKWKDEHKDWRLRHISYVDDKVQETVERLKCKEQAMQHDPEAEGDPHYGARKVKSLQARPRIRGGMLAIANSMHTEGQWVREPLLQRNVLAHSNANQNPN